MTNKLTEVKGWTFCNQVVFSHVFSQLKKPSWNNRTLWPSEPGEVGRRPLGTTYSQHQDLTGTLLASCHGWKIGGKKQGNQQIINNTFYQSCHCPILDLLQVVCYFMVTIWWWTKVLQIKKMLRWKMTKKRFSRHAWVQTNPCRSGSTTGTGRKPHRSPGETAPCSWARLLDRSQNWLKPNIN